MVTQLNPKNPTLEELIPRFTTRPGLAPKSREYYNNILAKFLWYARSQGWPADPSLITREHIRDLLDYVTREKYRWPESPRSCYKLASPATVHHYGVVVKTLFNWAEEEGYLEVNPIRRLKPGPPRYREVAPYSDEEVQAMLGRCEADARFRYRFLGLRNKAIISLFIDTGLRLAELADIRLSDLDPKLQQVQVVGKGAKARVVPINGEARKALRHYLEIRPPGDDRLWQTSDGQPLSAYSIQIMIQRLKRRAGIRGGGGPHRFRHYFATRYLENGGDLNTLRLLLGHSTLAMVLKYSRYIDVKKALAGHQQFSPLDRLLRSDNHNRQGDGWGWQRREK